MMMLLEKYSVVRAPEDGGGAASSSPSASSGDVGSSAPAAAPAGSSADSTPSSAPTPSSPSSVSSTGDGGLDFAAIFGSDGSAGADAPAGVPPATTPPTPLQPTPSGTPAAAPAEAPVVGLEVGALAAPVAAQATPDTAPPQRPPEAAVDAFNPAHLASHLASNEAAAVEFVAQQMFSLSNEEREALEQDVIGTIPRLLAKVFVKSQQNVLNQFDRLIPVMVQRHTQAMRANDENEGKFFSRWPQLDRGKHGDLARRYGAVYRQMHPNATLEQMIEDLGPMVMMAGRVVPSVGAPGQVAGQAVVGQAAAPARTTNGRPPPPSPFAPAGAGPAASSRVPEKEAWEAMFEHPGS
jgi:hypothetical protein